MTLAIQLPSTEPSVFDPLALGLALFDSLAIDLAVVDSLAIDLVVADAAALDPAVLQDSNSLLVFDQAPHQVPLA